MFQGSGKRRRQETTLEASRTTPIRDLSNVEEMEEMEGTETMESQKLKELIRATTSRKDSEDYTANFRVKIQKDKKDLTQRIQQQRKEAEQKGVQFQNQIATCLSSFGLPSQTQVLHSRQKTPSDDVHLLLQAASHLIEASREVEVEYKLLVAATNAARKESRQQKLNRKWEKDKEEVARLLENGMRLSLRRAKQLLPEATRTAKQGAKDPSSDYSYNETSRFFKTTQPQDMRLRETLHQATKGVKRMVLFLPEHDEI